MTGIVIKYIGLNEPKMAFARPPDEVIQRPADKTGTNDRH